MTAGHAATNNLIIAAIMLARVAKYLKRIGVFFTKHKHGMVLLSGPMRGGKTMTLITLIDALRDVRVLCIKPLRDDRQSGFCTHTGVGATAHNVSTVHELRNLVREHRPDVLIFDEFQFCNEEMANALLKIAGDTVVIVGMLDMTFDAEYWPAYTRLVNGSMKLENAFLHLKLVGVCQRCDSRQATHSMLTISPPEEGNVLTGDDIYRTVCESCHQPPPQRTTTP